jgi:hypothetical protein
MGCGRDPLTPGGLKDECVMAYHMARLTVYLPDELEKSVRALAKASGATVNKWITAQLTNVVRTCWSPEFLSAAGADTDFPEIENARYGTDAKREALD